MPNKDMSFDRGLFDTDIIQPFLSEKDSNTSRPKAWTVSQLTAHIKGCIEHNFDNVWVEGELSNFRVFSSGHCYFSLKDDTAQLSAVMWRGTVERLRFTPKDGQKALACGHLTVYESRGQYQIVVERLELLGVGDLSAAFEQLKKKLAAEGLFDTARKRPLPAVPRRIGIVTSPTGAAIHDLMKVIYARWPADILLCGARVQGAGAANEIAQGIELMNRLAGAERPDVLIIGRGGGSLEDLWAFNEEVVARAIFKSKIPVISAVGHEVDFTISDFVADARAATPSHAGEMVVPRLDEMLARLAELRAALPRALLLRVEVARRRLESIEQSYALRHPEERISALRQRLDDIFSRLIPAGERQLSVARERLVARASRLESLSPLKVLERGYSVTWRDDDGKIIQSAQDVSESEQILTRVKDGVIRSRVV